MLRPSARRPFVKLATVIGGMGECRQARRNLIDDAADILSGRKQSVAWRQEMSMMPGRFSAKFAALFVLTFAACTSVPPLAGAREARSPVLVRLSPEQSAVLATGLLRGALQPINGCVYFVDPGGTAYLAAWPDGYSLAMKGNVPIGVQDVRSGKMMAFGIAASFGGGHGNDLLRSRLAATIPAGCSGPLMTIHLIRQEKGQP
ncbi:MULTISPECIES: hypothetical protein [Stenotrophomonas]|uniref:hypothetical protein n=1 Tax=Stenotrophomonas TaxID=40323 RepID=UPI0015DE5E77|nr:MULTISPECIES: hypothetical protein [Stenotrophomonas]MDH0274601.1 hypothetical protein [Stenotrophomonas sp. GD04089]MDH1910353.1 hypothetical protein [Stenotrophomonas sp. GD03794]